VFDGCFEAAAVVETVSNTGMCRHFSTRALVGASQRIHPVLARDQAYVAGGQSGAHW
jgi:hypothetical protein